MTFWCFLVVFGTPGQTFLTPQQRPSSCLPRLAVGAKRLATLPFNRGLTARSRRTSRILNQRMLCRAFRPPKLRKIEKVTPSVPNIFSPRHLHPVCRLQNDDLYRMKCQIVFWRSTRKMESRYKTIESELGAMLCKTKF